MEFKYIKKLEEQATKICNIKPIKDKEYQRINYIKNNKNRYIQKRSKIYKSDRRFI